MIPKVIRQPLAGAMWRYLQVKDGASKNAVVVMGFPRSGTSMLCRLVAQADYKFGGDERNADEDNPEGYYEHRPFITLTEKFFQQAKLDKTFALREKDLLRAQGTINRYRRVLTRMAMVSRVNHFSARYKKWAVKFFPNAFYAWDQYFTDAKLICIYRDPIAASYSCMRKWPSSMSFEQTLDEWARQNQAMLYHLSRGHSCLIKYEDLLDPAKQQAISQKLATFLGVDPSMIDLASIQDRQRGNKRAETIRQTFPAQETIKTLYTALEDHPARLQ